MSETPQHVYPKASVGEQSANVAPNPDFPQLEQDVLRYWDTNGTFQKSIDENPSGEHSSNEFVFFDGPPFANGLPHYGHLLTGYAKDVVPRYQTMKGRARQPRGSAGTRTACPPNLKRRRSSASTRSTRSSRWASTNSTTPAAPPCSNT